MRWIFRTLHSVGKRKNKGHKPEKAELRMGFYSFRSGLLLSALDSHLLRDERPKGD